jgi:hypothetical protein
MDTITEVNCATGEVVKRELTADEIAQRKIDADNEKANAAAIAQAATDKAALLAKLNLTADELKILLS